MHVVILVSKLDLGGMNIASHLRDLMSHRAVDDSDQPALITLDREIVSAENFPDGLFPKPDLAIFASRHQSESGMPCLTAHFPGNFSHHALQGGKPRQLSMAAPHEMREAIRYLSAYGQGLDFQVTVEATHHGPLTDVPCFFIEIGSGREEWTNQEVGEIVARAILDAVGKPLERGPVAVGMGGPHYSNRFTELLLRTKFSLAHIVPKHHIGDLDEDMLSSLLLRSRPPAEFAIFDWKGMRGDERKRLITLLGRMGVEHLRLRHCLSR